MTMTMMMLSSRCSGRLLCRQSMRKSSIIASRTTERNGAAAGGTAAAAAIHLYQQQDAIQSSNSGSSRWFRFFSAGSDDDNNNNNNNGSHSDFAPQRRKPVATDEDQALALIQQHVKDNPIMLYMKGKPAQAMCGFSAKVVQILNDQGVDFSSVNVLDYPAIRDGIKKFSEWPTIPQLYVNGEFIGGCDIVTSLHESGELKELLQKVTNAKEEP